MTKTFSPALILLALVCCSPSPPSQDAKFPNQPTFAVTRVVDGDTIEVLIEGQKKKVRLIGVDTPEAVDPRRPVEEFGREASAFTKKLLEGKQVWLVSDPEGDTIDRYGRKLAHVYRAQDGLWVNLELIRQGYAHAYTRYPLKYMTLFRDAEREAKQAKRGLWRQQERGTPPTAPAPS